MGTRLDVYLVQTGLSETRNKAQTQIERGLVSVNGKVVSKVSAPISETDVVHLSPDTKEVFVSRGGEKLNFALDTFRVEVSGKICLDAGISTGGFADCLLRKKAQHVIGIEVGHSQLAESLQNNPHITLFEKTNIRSISKEFFERHKLQTPDLIVCDLSFVSLTKLFSIFWLLQDHREGLFLVKPQFEIGKEKLGKKGVVKATKDHISVLKNVLASAQQVGYKSLGLCHSPIRGGEGNIEYFLHAKEQGESVSDVSILCEQVVENTFSFFKNRTER